MKRVTITFAVEQYGGQSGTLSETVEITESLYDALRRDLQHSGGAYLKQWIANNLFHKVAEVIQGDASWRIVGPLI